jgi:drug/metabolite transporter (DMT)-like permease
VADWTTDAVDTLENVVASVRAKVVVPAENTTRVVVFGLLVSFFVLTAVTMLAIALFRVLVVLTGEVWAAYLILGGIFVLAGVFVWTLRASRNRNEDVNA